VVTTKIRRPMETSNHLPAWKRYAQGSSMDTSKDKKSRVSDGSTASPRGVLEALITSGNEKARGGRQKRELDNEDDKLPRKRRKGIEDELWFRRVTTLMVIFDRRGVSRKTIYCQSHENLEKRGEKRERVRQ